MEKALFVVSVCFLLLAVMILIYVRKQLLVYTKKLSASLDAMLDGERNIAFDEEKDTIIGKLQVKMRSLYEIMQERALSNRSEKEELMKMVSDLSHQVKTPIANIRMYHDILKREEDGLVKKVEFLQALDNQVDKLEFLIQSMIKMSRLEIGMIQIHPEINSIYKLLEQAVCDVAIKACEKQIEIEVECEEELSAYFDKKWTLEAVFNVLDNAVKYIEKEGVIVLSAKKTDFFVRIQIQDNGRGIEDSHITEIFKRFYREPEVSQLEGVGIGLYLAREIVSREKGFIEVRSEPGKGSTFSLHLPVEA